MKSLKQLIEQRQTPEEIDKRISAEFQDYAYRLMKDLNDEAHRGVYFRLVKTVDRSLLEQARRYVIDSAIDNKGALFMWKLKQLREERKKAKLREDQN